MLAEFLDRVVDNLSFWAIVGFGGQAIFASRFIVQWIHAERVRRSEIPLAFWYISLFGGVTLLVYAVHRADLVFIIGQVSGLVVYVRNLHLIYRERRRLAAEIT
ncbi:lipid-A-disaccharide synthase N-terminal domain-containing protein [Ferrovibrio sp.]|uniref:lipid-A-disaccharide synthase N-terminal domain-containing protein n=1 Tax=Ferrovibrio sp. TaxID=1917215 RepID=UPI003D14CD13